MSGTSMAAPHVAGVAALARQAHKKWNAQQISTALVTTADANKVTGYRLTLGGGRMISVPVAAPVIKFDTADAAWLSAYTHFLSGFVSTAQAYDPEPAIQRVMESSAAIYALWGDTPPENVRALGDYARHHRP